MSFKAMKVRVNYKRLPYWFVKQIPSGSNFQQVKKIVSDLGLNTVCEAACCPNSGECFSKKTVTFMILGSTCTRNCGFCAVEKGTPLPLALDEPERVALAVKKLNLRYVVITSVTRDDLPDGGALKFALTVKAIKKRSPHTVIEILTPDFKGSISALAAVVESKPDVFSHNIETVSRLYPYVRPQADYKTSLNLLRRIKEKAPSVATKSGFMAGLGEEKEEIIQLMQDLREVNCQILTIGQYLSPSREHLRVNKYYLPEEFIEFKAVGEKLGFFKIATGPLVKSSYGAEELFFGNSHKVGL